MSNVSLLDRIGVGIDTARYGHRVSFLCPDRQPAAKRLTVLENQDGYHALQQRLQELHQRHPKAHFPKRTTDDTESQAMARFAVVEQPRATESQPPQMVTLREVAGRLQLQVKQTTQAVNRLHNLLARVFPEFATLTYDVAARWVLVLLDKYPSAQHIAQAHLTSLAKIPYLPSDKVARPVKPC